MAEKRIHLWIEGRVQGVCFRMYTEEEARRLGLTGWVRNLNDGRVEMVAEGDEETVGRLVAWCHRGPSHARVDRVVEREEPHRGEFSTFTIAYGRGGEADGACR